ncbi:amino acid permease [Mycoplasmopsis canis PG 14]|uniref:amino acid permease n=1 Tax=Mycoplasmopsis canis TaxID=29555 RepID=UPI00025AD961|nr:APC family permease [Mycoplasmopsis canis]AMD81169.1 amino acid permease [Mycoplasmopsis canis PG 14]EIE39765.1 amino acid permease [Mycoplasmopsis canis PG 14]
MEKHFSAKTFTLFTINFIVGLGFITTITSVLELGYWGYLVIILSLFTVLGTSLVFSRLSNVYSDHYGGSYAFARNIDDDIAKNNYSMLVNSSLRLRSRIKKSFLRNFIYLVGWNQFIQSPILSSISPLLLSKVIEDILDPNTHNLETILWVIRFLAVLLFSFLIVISTFGLKLSTKVIFATSIIKWAVLAVGIILIMTQISANGYEQSLEISKKATTKLIFSNTLLFIFAFAGIEDMAAMTKDVKFKNFRVILLSSIAVIFVFYMISYTIMLGLESTYLSRKFYDYYSLTLGGFGLILFIVGFISNDIGYKITQTVSTARKLVPIAEDNLIHEAFSEKNSKNEYKKAIIFVAVFTLFSMITLSLVTLLVPKEKRNDYFDAVINMSCIALLIEDAMTFIVAFVLEKMKKISKIPFWEKIIYLLSILWAIFLVLTFFIPSIFGEKIDDATIFTILGYFSFLFFGIIIRLYSYYHSKLILKKTSKKLKH